MVSRDFCKLFDQSRMINWKTSELRKRCGGPLWLALLHKHARGLREDEQTADENDSPGELDSNWNSIGARIVPLASRVVDNGGKEKADSNGKLVAAYNGTSDPFGRGF